MPNVKIPITGPAYSNIDGQTLDERSVEVRNLYINEADYSEKRAGLLEWIGLGTGRSIDALYWWDAQNVVLGVSGGRVWKMTDRTGTRVELTAAEKLLVGQRVSIHDNGGTAALANGGKILTTTGTAAGAAFLTDPDAPTVVTHVAFIDQYLVANLVGTGIFQISEVGDLPAWRAIDIFTAESNPDVIKAVHVGLGEIVFFGTKSIEFWANDGVTPFSRINQATIERGIISPGTIDFAEDRWICMDEYRAVIEIRGRTPVNISMPVDRIIQSMLQVDTAIGQIYRTDGHLLYVLTFPQDRRTLVYNMRKQDWTEWDYLDLDAGIRQRFRGNAYCYARKWNLHLVGDHSNGKIYTSSNAIYNDDGNPIGCRRRSGFVSHGTFMEKECNNVWFRVKQSVATASVPNPQMMIRYRNANGAWGPERWIDIGPAGDDGNLVRLNQLGQYRTRQWEVAFTDDTPFVLADAEEDVTVLES